MKALTAEGLSETMLLPLTALEATELSREGTARDVLCAKFPCLKVLTLKHHDLISPVRYPNLFRAATARKRRLDGTFKGYRSTKDPRAVLTDKEIEDAAAEPPFRSGDLRQRGYPSLQRLYGVSASDLAKVLHERKKAS